MCEYAAVSQLEIYFTIYDEVNVHSIDPYAVCLLIKIKITLYHIHSLSHRYMITISSYELRVIGTIIGSINIFSTLQVTYE